MIRVLTMIAVAGFLVSAATLSAAVVLTGPQNIMNGAWSFSPDGWGGHWQGRNRFSFSRDEDGDGADAARDLAWTGGDALSVELDADVRYTEAPGPGKITVSGPQTAVQDVEIQNGVIRYKTDGVHDARLSILVTAPAVTAFTMQGEGKLAIANYHQDRLKIDLRGDGDVNAAGTARTVQLSLSGSGDADLRALKTEAATVRIDGSGDAALGPSASADIAIDGSGDVTLVSRPAKLKTSLSGSGRVRQAGEDAASDR